MIQTVNFAKFINAFIEAGRYGSDNANFTYEGLELLFDYFEEYEESTDQPIELDVIAICCEYDEMDAAEIAGQYDVEEDGIEEYLNDNTQFVGKTSSGNYVFQSF